MGCGASGQYCRMSFFRRHSDNNNDAKSKLERKLYIAKQSPEPEFDLSECELRAVPGGVYAVCRVLLKQSLLLSHNHLDSLAGGGQLSDLNFIKVLDLSFNNIRQIPHEIKYLINLIQLHLQNNCLINLPDTLQHLQSLELLDVSRNNLTQLPSSLGKLNSLQKLVLTGNDSLTSLCSELCFACNISSIELDCEKFEFPPPAVTTQGTQAIMSFLCEESNIKYNPPSEPQTSKKIEAPIQYSNMFKKQSSAEWEEQEAAILAQDNKYHQVAKMQRDKFLSEFIQEQEILDNEIAKIHNSKEIDRLRLVKDIHQEEKEIENLVRNFIKSTNLRPEVIQQQLQHEQMEHDRLLKIIRQNNDNVRKADILSAMENILKDNYLTPHPKNDHNEWLKTSLLAENAEISKKLENLYNNRDECRNNLVQQLLEDQDVQKAVVTSMAEQVDARSWSLNQEISLISSNLAKLSLLELEKKKLHVTYNFNDLMSQRLHLLTMLDDLMIQKNKRRTQLLATMKEMETQKGNAADFWLKNYQNLIESAPKMLLGVGKKLDPLLANYLVQEGVIHCLPFLFKFIFSQESLVCATDDDFKENGVILSADRDGLLRAIKQYISAKSENGNCLIVAPSAPSEQSIQEQSQDGPVTGFVSAESTPNSADPECVICMDARCEVVFVPCGHLCCCLLCSDKEINCCPMCRVDIERKMKVISA